MSGSPGIVYQTSRTIRFIHCRHFFFEFENLGLALLTCQLVQGFLIYNQPSPLRLCRPTWSEPPSLVRYCRMNITCIY